MYACVKRPISNGSVAPCCDGLEFRHPVNAETKCEKEQHGPFVPSSNDRHKVNVYEEQKEMQSWRQAWRWFSVSLAKATACAAGAFADILTFGSINTAIQGLVWY